MIDYTKRSDTLLRLVDNATRSAAYRAYREKGESFAVYVNVEMETVIMQDAKAAKPKGFTCDCIAQYWSESTVQVRYDGARSEWVKF